MQAIPQQIVGVVTPLGSWGLHTAQEGWMLAFHVKPWRVPGNEINTSELRVTKVMAQSEITLAKQSITPTSVLSFSVFDLNPTDRGTHTARLDTLPTPTGADLEMTAAAEELRRPVTVTTACFGTLTLDRRVDLFEGDVARAGSRVTLSIPSRTDSTDIDSAALSVAEAVWSGIDTLDQQARFHASARLLELKNDSWLDDEEAALTHEQFQDRISLHALHVDGDGEITFYYDDGNLFLGHSIDVSGTLEHGFTEASISG